jgi:hypothetical protein
LPGEDPQHAVSLGPGKSDLEDPDRDEWAAKSFFMFGLPQWMQTGTSVLFMSKSSLDF